MRFNFILFILVLNPCGLEELAGVGLDDRQIPRMQRLPDTDETMTLYTTYSLSQRCPDGVLE